MSFFAELKRRNVFRVAAAYVVVAWLVIQVVETIFPAFGFGDPAIRNATIVFVIGLVPALIFAWAFELTPEGLKRESEIDRDQSITPQTARKLDRIIIVLLALALAYFAFDKFVLNPLRESALEAQKATEVQQARQAGRTEALVESYGGKSIAVLPFVNRSSDAEQEYFSDGISEELLNLLARNPELRVISRSSAFSFKGQGLDIPQIAERLNVAHILEGSVRKVGHRVRITVQLIDARSDTQLWSETYDRTSEDIFAIQDEIATTVVEQLKITLLGKLPQVQEVDPEAYALYLQARHLGQLGTAEGFEHAIGLYQQALDIEPEYAAAWDGLARSYLDQAAFGLRPAEEGYTLAREAVGQALAIDQYNAQAHARLGWISMTQEKDLAQSAMHFEQALELDWANIAVNGNAAALLTGLGRLQEAIAMREYVTSRDPVNPTGHATLADSYLFTGRWREAITSFQTALRLSPRRYGAHYGVGVGLLFMAEAEAALAAFGEERDDEFRVKGQAVALYALGRQADFQAKLDELIERWGDQWPSEVAQVFAFSGDSDAAFQWLNQAIEQEEEGLHQQFLVPFYGPLHSDARWAAFLERVGSSPEQLDAIEFKVKLP